MEIFTKCKTEFEWIKSQEFCVELGLITIEAMERNIKEKYA